jgi:NADH:ubiquinone oxidoreductase subunit F (NADH-binding)
LGAPVFPVPAQRDPMITSQPMPRLQPPPPVAAPPLGAPVEALGSPPAAPPAPAPAARPARPGGTGAPAAPNVAQTPAAPAAPEAPRGTGAPNGTGAQPVQPGAPTGGAGTTEPRLLAGWLATGRSDTLADHLRRHGELPRDDFAGRRGAAALLEIVDRSGLRGRGGAGFPTARKLAAVAEATSGRRRAVVVANGCEGDPTSRKDALLLRRAPHLVLDGIALAAHAVGADQAMLCVHRGSPLVDELEQAIAERADDPAEIHVVTVPRRYVSSEASALVNFLTGGDGRPTASPPLPSTKGVQGRPTLVDNVETLAHLALIARRGADWFREQGTRESAGSTLITVGGAVREPGVFEVGLGARLGEVLERAGGSAQDVQAVLVGGFGGLWVPWRPGPGPALSYQEQGGVRLGIPSLVVLGSDACGLAATSAIVGYLAGESAGQCGPCMFGLPSVAQDLAELVDGRTDPELSERLARRLGVIPGRGACAHPDGAVRVAASALEVFADDVAEHLAGRPCGRPGGEKLPMLGDLPTGEGGWR